MAKYRITAPDGGTYEVTAPDDATQEQVLAYAQKNYKAPAKPEPSTLDSIKQGAGNLAAGMVRGAGSIGATLLAPIDVAADAIAGKGLTLDSNRQRRADMDAALSNMGAETDSLTYGGGKLVGEIMGTAGAGGAVANLVGRAVPAIAGSPMLQAIASGGMRAGGMAGLQAQAVRAAGGAVAGGAAAGLVNPEDVGTGALIGAATPGVIQAAGAAGRAIGGTFRGPPPSPELMQAAQNARAAGYVMPPTQVQPTMTNRLLEGFAGKLTTAQNASAKNQAVTNRLAATAVGLPGDAPITPDALNAVREEASKAYRALAALPDVPPVQGSSVMNRKAVDGFVPRQALEELKQARNDATAWFTAAGRSASPDDLKKAKAYAATASALEKQFESYAASIGRNDLVPAMQEARQLIAKTYTIEKALNPTTGTVDARKLGAMITKNKPLTGELREAGEFANRFKTASQTPESMGSLPQTSPIDWFGGIALGSVNPLAYSAVMARPATRAAILSGPMQNRMVQPGTNRLMQLAGQIPLEELATRSAPVIGVQ